MITVFAVNADAWRPDEAEMAAALACIQPEEATRIGGLQREIDRKLSTAGRHLLRRVSADAAGVAPSEVRLTRSERGKPALEHPPGVSVNMSHHGKWSLCAAHPTHMVGVDVMRYDPPTSGDIPQYFQTMQHTLTRFEWRVVRNVEGDETDQLMQFYRLWTLKEAYIKAVGIGLGMELQRMEFHPDEDDDGEQLPTAVLHLDGEPRPEWRFRSLEFDRNHITTVALGPHWEAVDAPADAPRDATPPPEIEGLRLETLTMPELVGGYS